MSIVPSISSVLSFLSFLTTVLALARVGAAAFASNQNQGQHLQRLQITTGCDGSLLSNASHMNLQDGEKGLGGDMEEKLKSLAGPHELLRMSLGWSRRPKLAFPPPAFLEEPQEPLSMAKLIMSRHSQRRPGRSSSPRRPPGLSPVPTRRSHLVEAV